MKAVILCGGRGLRMSGDANYTCKPLVNVGGKPILWHIMKYYKQFHVNEFILCLGYNGTAIKEYFINSDWRDNDFHLKEVKNGVKIELLNSPESWNIIFADTGLDTMTGGRIKKIQKYIDEDEFMVTYGDGLSDIAIDKLLAFHQEKGKIATVTAIRARSGYGIINVDEGIATKFEEKPVMDGWVNAGFFILNKKVFDYLEENEQCIWEDKPMRQLVEERELAVYQHDGFWQSVDTVKDVQLMNEMWNSNNRPWVKW